MRANSVPFWEGLRLRCAGSLQVVESLRHLQGYSFERPHWMMLHRASLGRFSCLDCAGELEETYRFRGSWGAGGDLSAADGEHLFAGLGGGSAASPLDCNDLRADVDGRHAEWADCRVVWGDLRVHPVDGEAAGEHS